MLVELLYVGAVLLKNLQKIRKPQYLGTRRCPKQIYADNSRNSYKAISQYALILY